jgi:transposase
MPDNTTDVEKASDTKEGSVEVLERRGARRFLDNVPRNKGVFGKARFLVSWNPLGINTLPSYGTSLID